MVLCKHEGTSRSHDEKEIISVNCRFNVFLRLLGETDAASVVDDRYFIFCDNLPCRKRSFQSY